MAGAFGRRCWRGWGYLLAGLPVALLAATVALGSVLVGCLLSLTVAGVLVVSPLLILVRTMAQVERLRCGLMIPAPPRPYRADPPAYGRARVKARLTDPATWRDLTWLIVVAPVELVALTVSVTVWAGAAGLISLPIWYRFLPGRQAKLYDSGGVAHGVVGSVPAALPWALGGLFLLWVGGWLVQALAIGQARLAAILLAPTRASRLRRRVADLTATRAAAVQVQQRELRRIERDLHDGAQARLVAMSVDLGLAGEAFDENPDQARQLLQQAREGLLLALAEIRNLVRGIGPPVLRDRGLPAAIEALAARNPIPVSVTIVLPHRPPATVETVAYFVVCEALTNATKHSRAGQVLLRVQADDAACLVTVTDDGVGGADQNGPGLRGLTDRVAAIDGSLDVESPSGGPTRLRAVLPCAW